MGRHSQYNQPLPQKQVGNVLIGQERIAPAVNTAADIRARAEYAGQIAQAQGITNQPNGAYTHFPGDPAGPNVPPELMGVALPANPFQAPAPMPFDPSKVPQQFLQQQPQQAPQYQQAPQHQPYQQAPQYPQNPQYQPQAQQFQQPAPPVAFDQVQAQYPASNQLHAAQQQQMQPYQQAQYNPHPQAVAQPNMPMVPPSIDYQAPSYGHQPQAQYPPRQMPAPFQQPQPYPMPNGQQVQLAPQNPNYAPPPPPSSMQQYLAEQQRLPSDYPDVAEVFRGNVPNEVPLTGFIKPHEPIPQFVPPQRVEQVIRYEMPPNQQAVKGYKMRRYLLTGDNVEFQPGQVLLTGKDDFLIDALIRAGHGIDLIPLEDHEMVTCPSCSYMFYKDQLIQAARTVQAQTHDPLSFQ